MASTRVPGGEYEFSELENQTILKTATWSKILGIVLGVNAAVALLNLDIINVGINVVYCIIFLGAAKHLRLVVETEGDDVTNLMKALDKINTVFAIRIVLLLLALGLLVIGGLIVLLMVGAR